jgi:hypothetical protein
MSFDRPHPFGAALPDLTTATPTALGGPPNYIIQGIR